VNVQFYGNFVNKGSTQLGEVLKVEGERRKERRTLAKHGILDRNNKSNQEEKEQNHDTVPRSGSITYI